MPAKRKERKFLSARSRIIEREKQEVAHVVEELPDGEQLDNLRLCQVNAQMVFTLNFSEPIIETWETAKCHVWWDQLKRYRVVRVMNSLGDHDGDYFGVTVGRSIALGRFKSLERAFYAVREWHVRRYQELGVCFNDDDVSDNCRQRVREAEEKGLDRVIEPKPKEDKRDDKGMPLDPAARKELTDHQNAQQEHWDKKNGKVKATLFGLPFTAILRWMGKQEWDESDARKVMSHYKIKLAESTVNAHLVAGQNGTRGEPAKLTLEQQEELLGVIF